MKQFPLSMVLETSRCLLRAPSAEDIPHIFSATRFAGFNDGMLWEPPTSVEELQGPLERSIAAWRAGTAYTFTVETQNLSIFVGRISIRKTEKNCVWDIGFWTHPEQQGKGYMTEAAAAILGLGFKKLDAERIEACHATWNLGSRRVLEKIGMTFVNHVPMGFRKNGSWIAEDCLSLSRIDWTELNVNRPEL